MIPRIPVDRAIERWLRALERAESMRSSSAMLAQAQVYGCLMHGSGGCPEPALCGLVAAEAAVRGLSEIEKAVLREKYRSGVCEEVKAQGAGGDTVIGVVARWRSDAEVGLVIGLRPTAVRRVLKHARARIWKAIRYAGVRSSG